MKTQSTTTADLSEFGFREWEMLEDTIRALRKYGLPEGFEQDEVHPMSNKNSGFVFLTNSEYQVAMMNGDKLELWHNCPNCRHEGFSEDCQLNEKGCNECNG